MASLVKALRLNRAVGSLAVAKNLKESAEALGHEGAIERWVMADRDGPYTLSLVDRWGNTGDLTIVRTAKADALETNDPDVIYRYFANTLNNFNSQYIVVCKDRWVVEVTYLNSCVKFDLEPDPTLFLTAAV